MSSGTAFRVHIRVLCKYPKKEISSVLTKNAEKQDMDDFDRFSAFLVKTDEISFLGYLQRTLMWTLNAVPDDICHLNEICSTLPSPMGSGGIHRTPSSPLESTGICHSDGFLLFVCTVVCLWAVEGGRELWWLLAMVTRRQQVSWMVVVEENGGGKRRGCLSMMPNQTLANTDGRCVRGEVTTVFRVIIVLHYNGHIV
jgi:hypothetical protein